MAGKEEQMLMKLLVEPGLMTQKQFDELTERAEAQQCSVRDLILDAGYVTDAQLGKLIAESQGFHFVDITREKIDQSVFQMIPEEMAREQQVVALRRTDRGVRVAMLDPSKTELQFALEKRFGEHIDVYATTEEGLNRALKNYRADMRKALESLMAQLKGNASEDTRDAVITKTVDELMQYGYEQRASDIHVEPFEHAVTVRFRIDGVLHSVFEIDKEYYTSILSRIKILARIRTDEHRAAQDGKFRFESQSGEPVDVRVSMVPTSHGENIVMRLLTGHARNFTLPELGLAGEDLQLVQASIKEPHGMILVTGPTGSGKSTTLYAVLKMLNSPTVNIATIEDPVEYDIAGMTQIQVNEKTNLTFAKGLRAIVRQDPDIIMVGEIRDDETAGIAINSALTGHLVLSTLHTNDAPTTLPRLLDMGIEPFLVSSTLNIVIAQRLVRRICASCITSYHLTKQEEKLVGAHPTIRGVLKDMGHKSIAKLRLYKGAGCQVCGNTGFQGRIGIFELLHVTDAVRAAVMQQKNSDEIREIAMKEGMRSMAEDGVAKALNGITTLTEVLRVAQA